MQIRDYSSIFLLFKWELGCTMWDNSQFGEDLIQTIRLPNTNPTQMVAKVKKKYPENGSENTKKINFRL